MKKKKTKAKTLSGKKRKVEKKKDIRKKSHIDKIARRRFRAESPFRKAPPISKLPPNVSWDELIFCTVNCAGKKGMTVEEICEKAIKIKYSKEEIKEKKITPRSLFHNSRITNIEAVAGYLDNSAYRVIYGYKEIS